jgi:hypothetical protein
VSRPRAAVAVVLLLIGAVWIGQGLGLIRGSAMTGSSFWAVVGAVFVIVALVVIVDGRRRRVHAADRE